MRKATTLLALALVLSLGLSAAAWARPWGFGLGGPGAMMNLTPEQAGQFFDLRQKFLDDTAGLRKQLAVKRAEMAALWKAENPDEKAIAAKQKEMAPLREQLMEKAVAFRLQAKKIAPQLPMGPGRGMGPGMGMGPCLGMGPGMGPELDLAMGPDGMGPGCPW
jgi:zinc resistance-associated protein